MLKDVVYSKIEHYIYLVINPKNRLAVWEKARGIWKTKKPNPISELRKMRREWERKCTP